MYGTINYSLQFPCLEGYSVLPEDDHPALLASAQTSAVRDTARRCCYVAFTSVLKGLQTHGQHDGCMASLVHLAFQIYEALRPRYLEIRAVMEQIPDIQKDSLDQFDCKLLNPTLQKVADKRRKDQFKRLIAGCIGKPLGEQFRKEVHIKNLPSLFQKN